LANLRFVAGGWVGAGRCDHSVFPRIWQVAFFACYWYLCGFTRFVKFWPSRKLPALHTWSKLHSSHQLQRCLFRQLVIHQLIRIRTAFPAVFLGFFLLETVS
jgi:hypothetical protein